MDATRQEALDIFERWLSDGCLVRCNLFVRHKSDTKTIASALNGRVRSIATDEVLIRSDDHFSELMVPLLPSMRFGYITPLDLPYLKGFAGEYIVVLPEAKQGMPDGFVITLGEIKDETKPWPSPDTRVPNDLLPW